MPDSMAEYLRVDMDCEGLLDCFHGLTDLDRRCFAVVAESDTPLTIDEIADEVDRERSTVYRSLQRLLQTGFVQREQVNYDQGGGTITCSGRSTPTFWPTKCNEC